MSNCTHCGTEIIGDPFYCSQCGQNYCSYHKDPIDHDCNIVKESLNLQQPSVSSQSFENAPQIISSHQENTYQQNQSPGIVR